MPRPRSDTTERLLALLREAYYAKAWHGTTLKGALRGVRAAQAAWRPTPGRKNIAEQVLHCAFWKSNVFRRISDSERSWPLKGTNWITVGDDLDEKAWKAHRALLDAQHEALCAAVATLAPARLDQIPPGGATSCYRLIQGAALHDLYHTGQIQILKRELRSKT